MEGQLVFNTIAMRLEAALQGLGLAFMPEDLVQDAVAQGRLIRVLEDWCEPFFRLPPLLSQSPPKFTGLHAAARSLALRGLTGLDGVQCFGGALGRGGIALLAQ
nr:hypothetical protein GCM10020185_81100 [Pseudomonas brassicacearum subsp. brassicacearum]